MPKCQMKITYASIMIWTKLKSFFSRATRCVITVILMNSHGKYDEIFDAGRLIKNDMGRWELNSKHAEA